MKTKIQYNIFFKLFENLKIFINFLLKINMFCFIFLLVLNFKKMFVSNMKLKINDICLCDFKAKIVSFKT